MKAKKINISDIHDDTPKGTQSAEMYSAATVSEHRDSTPKSKSKSKLPKIIEENRPLFTVIAISSVLILVSLFSIYQITRYLPKDPPQIIKHTKQYLAAQELVITTLPALDAPDVPRTETSPLNGKLLTTEELEEMMERRAVAVMVNNHLEARPQSNLQQADIVYETLAEGGITRLMPLYWSKTPDKVGPIRSARQYFIDWVREYDAIYLHDGCASADLGGDLRVDACGNLYRQRIKTLTTYGAWRDNSGGRVAPHNEYTSVEGAVERADELGWGGFPTTIPAWKFKRDSSLELRGDMTAFTATFLDRLGAHNGYRYDARWDYDRERNLFVRSTGGSVHEDQETDQPLTAKVVIVQTVDGIQSGDSKGHLIIDTTGEGDATIFQDGKAQAVRWRKNEETDRTKYYDNAGNEVELNRGLIWIMAIPDGWGGFDIIAQ
ncbi:MAG: DUF3048 domain-containing protein [Candidatus Dojkabacteria bacterium]|nr:MAG: DUF3048 domain-containing protein [Candidatus Dojkabacteria bacterium]